MKKTISVLCVLLLLISVASPFCMAGLAPSVDYDPTDETTTAKQEDPVANDASDGKGGNDWLSGIRSIFKKCIDFKTRIFKGIVNFLDSIFKGGITKLFRSVSMSRYSASGGVKASSGKTAAGPDRVMVPMPPAP